MAIEFCGTCAFGNKLDELYSGIPLGIKSFHPKAYSMKVAPDIIVAGFPKCGTTTLAEQLNRMPEMEFFVKGKKGHFQGRGHGICDLIREDVAKYSEAGIYLSKFPILNQGGLNQKAVC